MSEVAHPDFLPNSTSGSRSIQFFATLDASADITALLRNNSRTKGAPFARGGKMSRASLLPPPGRLPPLLKSVLIEEHNAVLAQFINGRIHRPRREREREICTRQPRKVVGRSKVSPLASLGDAIISPSPTGNPPSRS